VRWKEIAFSETTNEAPNKCVIVVISRSHPVQTLCNVDYL